MKFKLLVLAGAVSLVTACAEEAKTEDKVEVTPAPEPSAAFATYTVDASDNKAYVGVNLTTGETTADLENGSWHIAVRRLDGIALNGGVIAGKSNVTAALASDTEGFYVNGRPVAATFENATPAAYEQLLTQNYDFATIEFSGETMNYAIGKDWYTTSGRTITVDANKHWVVMAGDQYFVVKGNAIAYNPQTHQSTLAFDIAPLTSAGVGSYTTLTHTPAGTSYSIDLNTSSVVETAADAELTIELSKAGYNIALANGAQAYGSLTADELAAVSVDAPMFFRRFDGDRAQNVFTNNAWFEYGVAGGHKVWPNYRTYAVDLDGDKATLNDVFFVQAVNYYHQDTGTSGHITLRVSQNKVQ